MDGSGVFLPGIELGQVERCPAKLPREVQP